jgi:hypothetical protein
MKKRFLFIFLIFSILPVFAEKLLVYHQRSLPVKQNMDKTSKVLGMAYAGEMYTVVKKKVGYYLIQLPDESEGWIQVKASYRRMEEQGDTLLILDTVVTVYDELSIRGKNIGFVRKDDVLPIIKREYSHYKLRLYDGVEGWIYGGKPASPWVTLLQEEKKAKVDDSHFIVDLSSSVIDTNVEKVELYKANFLNSQSCHQFFEPYESKVTVNFSLEIPNAKYLELTHAIKSNESVTSKNITIIDVFINDFPLVRGLSVSGEMFYPTYLYVPTHLQEGLNTLSIHVQSLSSPYLLQKIRIFNSQLMKDFKGIEIQ